MKSIIKLASDWVNLKLLYNLKKKHGKLNNIKPIISFTFDDFPVSAFEQALPILDKYGIKATYYVAMGLEGGKSHVEPMFQKQMVKELFNQGHEIGSHTFNHINCRRSQLDLLEKDLFTNNAELNKITNNEKVESFSYPFGEATPKAKGMVNNIFSSSRGIQPGINKDIIDLNFLKANKLYSNLPVSQPIGLIEKNKNKNTWLIFYTHDVRENPSKYGCTPYYFEEVVKTAVESGAIIIPVKEALKFVELSNKSGNQ